MLQRRNMLGHARLRDAEPPGGAGEAAVAGHLDEDLHGAQSVHGLLLFAIRKQ
jgi:hypothetical protein